MDLITSLRQRVFELVDGIKPPSRYKVVVVDHKVKSLLSLVVENGDLLNREVANVLTLDASRQREQFLDAIYLVEENYFSYGCIEADFQNHRYMGAHIFFLPSLESSESERAKFQNTLANHKMELRGVHELPFNFFAVESRLFTTGLETANLRLYNQELAYGITSLIEYTAKSVVDVCKTLKIEPYIRFSHRASVVSANKLPFLVANAVNQMMPKSGSSQRRSTLLILDRSIDMGAPLRHSALFQALSQDITDGKGAPPAPASEVPEALQGKTLGIKFEDFKGGYPSESDKIWVSLRHQHVVQATQELNRTLKELRAANPQFEQNSSNLSVNDVRNMLAALPEFMKARESVGLNLDLAHQCFEKLEQSDMQMVFEYEQLITLGTDDQGQAATQSRLADLLVAILASKLDTTTKLRTMSLYVLHRCGIKKSDYERLMKHARFKPNDIATIKHMNFLGVPTIDDGYSSSQVPPPLTKELPLQPYKFHRIQTGLATVLQLVLHGKLPDTEFPYVGDAPDAVEEALTAATSLRNHRQKATWAQNVKPQQHDEFTSNQKTIVVFMLGGFTGSEAAASYEIAKKSKMGIFLGGHDFLTPKKFVDFVSNLQTSPEELNLPENQPQVPVPAHLLEEPKPVQKPSQKLTKAPPSQQRPAIPAQPQKLPNTASNQHPNTFTNIPQQPRPAPVQPQRTDSFASGYTENGIMYLGSPPPVKDKKNMKKRLKGALNVLKR